MSERSITFCVVPLQEAWFAASKEFEETYPNLPKPILTCTYRSPEEQNMLYSYPFDGLDNDHDGRIDEPDEKVTNAKAGQSYHNYYPARAFDIGFKTKSNKLDWSLDFFRKFAAIIKKHNPKIGWGGDWKKFKDYPHFELRPEHDEI